MANVKKRRKRSNIIRASLIASSLTCSLSRPLYNPACTSLRFTWIRHLLTLTLPVSTVALLPFSRPNELTKRNDPKMTSKQKPQLRPLQLGLRPPPPPLSSSENRQSRQLQPQLSPQRMALRQKPFLRRHCHHHFLSTLNSTLTPTNWSSFS